MLCHAAMVPCCSHHIACNALRTARSQCCHSTLQEYEKHVADKAENDAKKKAAGAFMAIMGKETGTPNAPDVSPWKFLSVVRRAGA